MIRPSTVLLVVALGAAGPARAEVPHVLGFQGRLLQADGTPTTGVVPITYALYDAETGGTKLWSETLQIGLTEGFYSTFLGRTTPLGDDLFDGRDRFLQVTVDGEDLLPRQRVAAVPYALRTAIAESLAGGAVDATRVAVGGQLVIDETGHLAGSARYGAGSGISIDGTTISLATGCAAGQVLKWSGSAWACGAAGATYSAGGGLELSGGAFALTSTCSAGQVLKFDGAAWACGADADTRYTAGSGLELNGAAFSLPTTCSAAQILRWDGRAWACAGDGATGGTVTNVSVAAPLTVTNASSTPMLSLAQASSVSAGFLSATDWATFNAKLDGVSTAGGDVSGSLSNLTVAKLQGSAVAATAPVAEQVLKWSGSAWAPAADVDTNSGGTVTSVTASGPLSVATGSTTPALSITQASSVSAGFLTAADWASFNAKLDASSAAGGDLSGTLPGATVTRLQGRPVASAAPASGEVLKWNGGAWAPAADVNSGGTVTNVTASGPISVASGTTTPAISIAMASGTTDGFLSAADWTTFSGKLDKTGGTISGSLTVAGALTTASASVSGTVTAQNVVLTGGTIGTARVENAAADPLTCDAAHAGQLYFNTARKSFYGCNAVQWVQLSPVAACASLTSLARMSLPHAGTGICGPYGANVAHMSDVAATAYGDFGFHDSSCPAVVLPAYVSIDFGASTPKLVTKVRIQLHTNPMKAAAFQGSNDSTDGANGTWTTIAGPVDMPSNLDLQWWDWPAFSNATVYRWYRIYSAASPPMALYRWELDGC